MDAEKTTLLAAIEATDGDAETAASEIAARLERGNLQLTGNFKGQEAEIARQAGDWERK
jgi:hypothetical protein